MRAVTAEQETPGRGQAGSRFQILVLPGRAGPLTGAVGFDGLIAVERALRPARPEAVVAVNRAFRTWLERNLGLVTALAANRAVHLAIFSRCETAAKPAVIRLPSGLVRSPASWATAGLVGEALFGIEFLLTDREHEVAAAVATVQGLVYETHLWENSFYRV